MRSAALAVLVACADAPNLPLRMDPAPPAGSTIEVIAARDGTRLLARRWAPAAELRGVVVIMHGLKDYSARYAAFAAKLAAHGYAVYAFDLRGHGRSAGPRVAPDDWNDYVDDLDRFLTRVAQREPGAPLFLFGHSMGGAIAARAAELHHPALAGLVLSGPALAIDGPPLLIAVTRLVGFLTPNAPALALDNRDFSSDPRNAAVMDRDELIEQDAAPARTAAGLVEGMHAIWADVDQLTMPVLALHGTADRLTAPSGSRALIEAIPARDKTLRVYDGDFHDLVHEPNGRGAKVEDDVVAWLDAHTGGPAVVAPPITADHLAGDPRGWTQSVALGGGYDAPFSAPGGQLAGDAAIDLARPGPIGWHGALTAWRANRAYALGLRPVGVAVSGDGIALGVSAGIAIMDSGPSEDAGIELGTRLAYSGGVWYEQPLGPVHVSVHGEVDREISSGNTVYLALGAIRLGGDRRYWPHARAGVGPLVSSGVEYNGYSTAWIGLVGFQLYGAD